MEKPFEELSKEELNLEIIKKACAGADVAYIDKAGWQWAWVDGEWKGFDIKHTFNIGRFYDADVDKGLANSRNFLMPEQPNVFVRHFRDAWMDAYIARSFFESA